MKLTDLKPLIDSGDITKLMSIFDTHCLVKGLEECLKQYEPRSHKVLDKAIRKDKDIQDDKGSTVDVVPVARLPLAFQKKIVLISSSFLGTPAVEATPATDIEKKLLDGISRTWKSNKLDYKFKTIAKKTMTIKQSAEIWFVEEVEKSYWKGTGIDSKYRLRMKVLSPDQGDTLYPVFDEFGDMIAFARSYKVKDIEEKETEFFDLYTAESIYYAKSDAGTSGTWLFKNVSGEYTSAVTAIPNIIKKIPVVYYQQPLTEWDDVQYLIERLEIKMSNHADTNDYYDSPIVKAKGKVEGFATKGESGKVLEMEKDADVEYLTYDNLPASMKLEMDQLMMLIYSLTNTPNISFDNMKDVGVFSGISLKMLFMDAHLKAADKEEMFGECLQRRINYITAALVSIDKSLEAATTLEIRPKFTYFLPKNIMEEIDILVAATQAKILSRKTAVTLNPLVSNVDTELVEIKADVAAATPATPPPAK